MAGPTASPETDRPTDTGGVSPSTEGSTTMTTGTELKKLKDLFLPDGDLSVFFLPFAYLVACVGAAKTSNRMRLTQWTDENFMAFNFVMMYNLATRRQYLPFAASFFWGKYQ